MHTWGELFESAADYQTTVEAVCESLTAHREREAGTDDVEGAEDA